MATIKYKPKPAPLTPLAALVAATPAAKPPATLSKVKLKAPVSLVAEPVEAIEPCEMTLEQLADHYGTLKDRADALLQDPVFVHLEEATKELKAHLAAFNHDSVVSIKGSHWLIKAGVCSASPRKIVDVAKVMKFLGEKPFLSVVTVPVTAATKYLTPDQLAEVISPLAYTENRKIEALFLG